MFFVMVSRQYFPPPYAIRGVSGITETPFLKISPPRAFINRSRDISMKFNQRSDFGDRYRTKYAVDGRRLVYTRNGQRVLELSHSDIVIDLFCLTYWIRASVAEPDAQGDSRQAMLFLLS